MAEDSLHAEKFPVEVKSSFLVKKKLQWEIFPRQLIPTGLVRR